MHSAYSTKDCLVGDIFSYFSQNRRKKKTVHRKPRTDNEVLVSRRKISHIFVRKPHNATALLRLKDFDMKNFSWLRNCFAFQNRNTKKDK